MRTRALGPAVAWSTLAFLAVAVTTVTLADDAPPSTGTTEWREGFEGTKNSWRREETDATVAIEAHERSNRAAHEGRTSERFAFGAGPGSVLYFSHSTPKAPLTDQLRASLYVRSNRPGVQLFARVVLPADLDPDTGRPSFLLVPGEASKEPDRWEKLELSDLEAATERQARVLRVGSSRRVSLEGAYVERLVVNLYGGAGETEVFLDEATLGPIATGDVEPEQPEIAKRDGPAPPATNPRDPGRTAPKDTYKVRVESNQILRDNADWVPSIIDAVGADPMALRQAGFDVLALPFDAQARLAEEAVRSGLLLMPGLDMKSGTLPETIMASIERYPFRDQVAFWNLGESLGEHRDPKTRKEEVERVRKVIFGLHDQPPGRAKVAVGTIFDELQRYALSPRNIDILAIEPSDWATIRNPLDTRLFLAQRRDLSAHNNPHAPFLAWVQATAPAHASRNVWGQDEPPAWGRPQIQPDQIRMQVFAALMAGYRAIGYRADAEITSEAARPRLMEMAILNAEIELIEPIIARGADPIQFWNTFDRDPQQLMIYNSSGAGAGFSQQKSNAQTRPQKEVEPHKSIKAASIQTVDGRGRILLVADLAPGGQHQPPQMGVNDLRIMVQVPENSQALEITPAGVNVLPRERVTGGIRFTIPTFSGTAIVLVTTDLAMKQRLDDAVAMNAPMASDFAIQQARAQLREVSEINAQLERDGHPARDSKDLIRQADDHIKSAVEARERLDFSLAWFEARWVGRALRVLQRMHFEKAYRDLAKLTNDQAKLEERKGPYPWIAAVSWPPLTSWQTLPEAYSWLSGIRGDSGPFSENLLASGQFDDGGLDAMARLGWSDVSHITEGAESKIEIVEGAGYGGKNSALRLLVAPKSLDPKQIDKIVPFIDHEAAAVRTPPIPVVRDGLYRIRVLVRLNRQLPAATGGLIVRDSLGGKPYEFRAIDACPFWREVTLYRVAPSDGNMTITLGLAGYTDAYFDRLRVDTIAKPAGGATPREPEGPIARRPSPPSVNPNTVPRR